MPRPAERAYEAARAKPEKMTLRLPTGTTARAEALSGGKEGVTLAELYLLALDAWEAIPEALRAEAIGRTVDARPSHADAVREGLRKKRARAA